MNVYFVRHGKSEGNENKVFQPSDSALSEQGMQQAQTLAERFRSIPVDVILASPLERARQTAEVINEAAGKEIVVTELLQEIKRPSEVIGRAQNEPEVRRIFERIDEHAADPSWHYSDEESFTDLKKRGEEFLSFLEARTEENVLCVTHGAMMRMIICLMLYEDLTWELYKRFWQFFQTKNTGITVCTRQEDAWKLLTWNDHAHLG